MSALAKRDYTIIVDKSGSMSTADVNGKSRWDAVREGVGALARKIEQYDKDGLTLYAFNGAFKRHDNVTADKVDQVWQEHEPKGSTALHLVLKDALDNYFTRKAAGQTKEGETLLVATDGVPDDKEAVVRVIIEAANKIEKDEELAIQMLQIGKDADAAKFLKGLDDDLTGKGAKFDIVDTTTWEDAENMSFDDLLLKTIND